MRRIDLTLQKFGRLTVIEYVGCDPHRNAYWRCLCDCGRFTIVNSNNLRFLSVRSCGCLRVGNHGATRIHGASHARNGLPTKEYGTWAAMLRRCRNSAAQRFSNYGGRGIEVCERWQKFENFLADVGYAPAGDSRAWSIDRIDNDGNYEPGNVRWATPKIQARNRRKSVKQC